MKRLVSIALAAVVVAGLLPSAVLAGGRHGGGGVHGGHGGHRGGSMRIGSGFHNKGFVHNHSFPERRSVLPFQPPPDPWKFWPPGVHKHHHGGHFPFTGFGNFGGFGFVGTPSVVVASPGFADPYGATAFAYDQGPAYRTSMVALAAPATLPTQTLVDFPTGWYQLRGDGVTTPYTWVWIPKPPTGGPSGVIEASPPTPDPGPSAAPSQRVERGPAYHWTDNSGVTTWTNRLDRVPKRFRDQAASSATPE